MGRKRKHQKILIFCYYCDRDFANERTLIQHQRAKHFKCDGCGRKLNSAKSMQTHLIQIHGDTIDRVPCSIKGRDCFEYEIFGMTGVPTDLIQAKIYEETGLYQMPENKEKVRPHGASGMNFQTHQPSFEPQPPASTQRLADHSQFSQPNPSFGFGGNNFYPSQPYHVQQHSNLPQQPLLQDGQQRFQPHFQPQLNNTQPAYGSQNSTSLIGNRPPPSFTTNTNPNFLKSSSYNNEAEVAKIANLSYIDQNAFNNNVNNSDNAKPNILEKPLTIKMYFDNEMDSMEELRARNKKYAYDSDEESVEDAIANVKKSINSTLGMFANGQ